MFFALGSNSAFADGEYPTWPKDFPKGVFRLSAVPPAGANWQGLQNPGLIGKVIEKGELINVKSCSSMNDPKCVDVNSWGSSSLFDFCNTPQQLDCIDSIKATRATGEVLQVKISDVFPGPRPQDYVGDPTLNLPDGGSTRLFTIDGITHEGGTNFY